MKDDPDMPNYFQVMTGDSAHEYWTSMQDEGTSLEKHKTQNAVPHSKAAEVTNKLYHRNVDIQS
jgi:hypothetical protein